MLDRKIDYERWRKTLLKLQLIVAIIVLIVEVADNAILYLTRSQGYGPDTIVIKLARYLLLTSAINFLAILAGHLILKYGKIRGELQQYILVMTLEVICVNVTYAHYQFTIAFAAFLVPLMVTVLYEDKKLNHITLVVSAAGLLLGVISRGMDPEYNKDIIPEACVAYSCLLCFYALSNIIIDLLAQRRKELGDALVQAERAKYVDILNEKNQELESEKAQLQQLLNETFLALSKAVDFNDHYTNGHSRRVAEYARELARRLGIQGDRLTEIYYAGLLHDIGKIGVDNSILNKISKLTDAEFETIKMHPSMGFHILKDISVEGEFSAGAKWHHERYDGTGYPDGLSGENIPFIARVISVADAYDAMTSKRSYRNPLSQERVRQEIQAGRGTQFDPAIADAMLQMIDEDRNFDLRQHLEYKKCILIIGGMESCAREILEILRDGDYELLTADTIVQGLMLMVDTNVDFIFIEVELAGIGGFRAFDVIRGEGYLTPILFLSESRDLESIQRSKEMGAVDYLTKPIRPNVLRGILQTVLSDAEQ